MVQKKKRPPMMESLESRRLMAAGTSSGTSLLETAQPLSIMGPKIALSQPASTSQPAASETVVGLTPQQVRHAYNVDKIYYKKKGKLIRATGEGQAVAIVVANDHPRITSDFKVFNRTFGLPNYGKDGKLLLQKKVAPSAFGFTAPVPPVDRGWAGEAALDVQWVHSIAPRAKIFLVEAQSATPDDVLMAIDFARKIPGVSVVSMSLSLIGINEFPQQTHYDDFFTTPAGHIGGAGLKGNIAFIAANGDWSTTIYPAVSANVLAVGGTKLIVDAVGNRLSEIAWSSSGGGIPQFADPKAAPDVALNADPETGVAVYNSLPDFAGETGWTAVGGTSAGAPQWAGIMALINEGRAILGKGSLGTDEVFEWLGTYPSASFNDIVTGSNGVVSAGPGIDLITGIGTPKAHKVVRNMLVFFELKDALLA